MPELQMLVDIAQVTMTGSQGGKVRQLSIKICNGFLDNN
jgi:hypothetical protein